MMVVRRVTDLKDYEIIDAHCHIYPDKIAQRAADSTGECYDLTPFTDGKISTLLEQGEKVGLHHFIVQSVATSPSQVSSINQFIANAVEQSEGRFTGLGTLHPESEHLEAEVEEIIRLGLKGVKLHPDIQKYRIDDPRMMKIYELCEGKLPILLHTGDSRFDYSNPNRVKPVLDTYKNLTVVGAHLGGWSVWDEAVKVLPQYENFYVDCSSSLYTLPSEKATELIKAYGTKRVLFGTDYPMWDPQEEIDNFMKLELTEEEREDILHNNAVKIFDIK